jgi:hypothetical protein
MAPDELEQLITNLHAVEQIKRLKARYSRAIDTRDWAATDAVFTRDFTGEVRSFSGQPDSTLPEKTLRSPAEWVSVAREALFDESPLHHMLLPDIEVTSATTAKGIWVARFGFRSKAGSPRRSVDGYGHYHDTYECVSGEWLIKHTRLIVLISEAA